MSNTDSARSRCAAAGISDLEDGGNDFSLGGAPDEIIGHLAPEVLKEHKWFSHVWVWGSARIAAGESILDLPEPRYCDDNVSAFKAGKNAPTAGQMRRMSDYEFYVLVNQSSSMNARKCLAMRCGLGGRRLETD